MGKHQPQKCSIKAEQLHKFFPEGSDHFRRALIFDFRDKREEGSGRVVHLQTFLIQNFRCHLHFENIQLQFRLQQVLSF